MKKTALILALTSTMTFADVGGDFDTTVIAPSLPDDRKYVSVPEDLPLHITGPFTLQTEHGSTIYYSFEGKFDENTHAVIDNFLDLHPEQVVFIANSPGGAAGYLLKAMKRVHEHGNVTFVTLDGATSCISACAFVASAAKEAYGKFYYHSIYAMVSLSDGHQVKMSPYKQNYEMVAWYLNNGYPAEFATTAVMQEETYLEVLWNGDPKKPVNMAIKTNEQLYYEAEELMENSTLPEILK